MKEKKQRLKFYEYSKENDIKFSGPITYRIMRIIGWVSILCIGLNAVIGIANNSESTEGIRMVLSFFSDVALPAFFLANLSIIIRTRNNYKKTLLGFIIPMGLIWVLLYGFLFRYFFELLSFKGEVPELAEATLNLLLNSSSKLSVSLNLFVDLTLCALFWFFISYHPIKYFQGKKILIFRLFAVLPVLYEIASMTVKLLPGFINEFYIPFYIFPLLTNKPPLMFFAFLAITIYLKLRERSYVKHIGSLEGYDEFTLTNANNFQVARFSAIAFIIAGVIDFILLVALTCVFVTINNVAEEEFVTVVEKLYNVGIGASISLISIVPFVFFYSYTKTHKNTLIDKILPVAAIALIAFICLEVGIDTLFFS